MEPALPLTTLLLASLGVLFAIFVESHPPLELTPAPAPAPPPLPPPPHPPPTSPPISPPRAVQPGRLPPRPLPPSHHPPARSPNEMHPNSIPSEHGEATRSRKQNLHLNTGKKIGFIFAGIAVIMQIVVVGFLAFKRKQRLVLGDR